MIIRSHGVPKYIYDLLKEKQIACVDVTCPFVLKIHRIVAEESLKGRHIVIVGNADHPEVVGIKGWCEGPCTVIKTKEEAKNSWKKAMKRCVLYPRRHLITIIFKK